MKPFTTTEKVKSGRSMLRSQILGASWDELVSLLIGDSIVAVSVPESQSLQEAWYARLLFLSGKVLDISASSTRIADWQEMATLNLTLLHSQKEAADVKLKAIECHLEVREIGWVVSTQGDVDAESSISIVTDGGEVFISTGEIPGELSIELPRIL